MLEESDLKLSIELPSVKIAKAIYLSVAPETKQSPGYRSSTRLESRGRTLVLDIQARDIVALRAASNSFLRFIAATLRTIETIAPFYRTRRLHRINGAS